MNKAQLIDAIATESGMTKVDVKKALDATIAVAKNELKKDGKIALVGFGTIATAVRPARKGHNPKTGKAIKIAAKKVVKFKPAANILK
jgi:DNA-binding protein HU-beta